MRRRRSRVCWRISGTKALPKERPRSARAHLPSVSEEMKAWSSALVDEVGGWPQASARSFFGFTALYRGEKMFAALPRTRTIAGTNSVAFKLEAPTSAVSARLQKDSRIRLWSALTQKARWFTFGLSSDADLHDALDWLGQAYEAAPKNNRFRLLRAACYQVHTRV